LNNKVKFWLRFYFNLLVKYSAAWPRAVDEKLAKNCGRRENNYKDCHSNTRVAARRYIHSFSKNLYVFWLITN